MIAFNDLKVCKVCISRRRKSVGNQVARVPCQRSLVILKGIACLQHIRNNHLIAAARKANRVEGTAGELNVFKALGIGVRQSQAADIAAENRHG